MTINDEIVIFRPDVSSYQAPNFRTNEMAAFSGHKYFSSFEDLKLYISDSTKIIFISTSNTQPLKYREIFNQVMTWIHPNSGYDNLSLEFIEEAHFPIINGNLIRADAVFQYIVQTFLQSLGSIPFIKKWDSQRKYPRRDFYTLNTLIIGHGHIGQKLSTFLKSTNINFDIYDPYVYDSTTVNISNISKYDVVFLCCGLNATSKYIIGSNLKTAKNNLVIINGARGELINEADLVNFLESRPEAMAYLDVFEEEPCDLSKFSKIKNIFMSSHIAGVYDRIDQRIIQFEQSVLFDIVALERQSFLKKYEKSNLQNKVINGYLI